MLILFALKFSRLGHLKLIEVLVRSSFLETGHLFCDYILPSIFFPICFHNRTELFQGLYQVVVHI